MWSSRGFVHPSHFIPICFIAKWGWGSYHWDFLNINQTHRVRLQSVLRQKVDLYLHLIHSSHYKSSCQPQLSCCFCERGAELSAKAMFVSAGKCLLLLLPVLGGVAIVEGWVFFYYFYYKIALDAHHLDEKYKRRRRLLIECCCFFVCTVFFSMHQPVKLESTGLKPEAVIK